MIRTLDFEIFDDRQISMGNEMVTSEILNGDELN